MPNRKTHNTSRKADALTHAASFSVRVYRGVMSEFPVQALIPIGLKVTFQGRDGVVLGIVTKINRKSVIVLGDDGKKQYKISPGLLRPLRDVK